MKPSIYCTDCGFAGSSKSVTPGSFALELILWLFLIVPGVIYSVWRISSRHNACCVCGSAKIIPADSPRARAELASRSQVG